ncbi:hypothetical protein AAHC03_012916 [Spirometra sp. Aus1]
MAVDCQTATKPSGERETTAGVHNWRVSLSANHICFLIHHTLITCVSNVRGNRLAILLSLGALSVCLLPRVNTVSVGHPHLATLAARNLVSVSFEVWSDHTG